MVKFALPCLALLLTACGYKGPVSQLEPAPAGLEGDALQQAKKAEKKKVEQGLTISAQARPIRVDELTVKLDVRKDDPFNLPPEGTKGSNDIPFPGEEPENRTPFEGLTTPNQPVTPPQN